MRFIILLCCLIYVVSIFFGFAQNTAPHLYAYQQTKTKISQKISPADLKDVLSNNLIVIAAILLGFMSFGSTTVMNLAYNGIYFGATLAESIQKGASLYEILFLTLPHGIFEIPAIIIAGAAGFKIPYEIIRYLAGKKEQILAKEDIKEYLTLSLISIILIIIAAWIEANITLRIAKAMLNRSI